MPKQLVLNGLVLYTCVFTKADGRLSVQDLCGLDKLGPTVLGHKLISVLVLTSHNSTLLNSVLFISANYFVAHCANKYVKRK